jgi:hypothetical protein
MFTDQQQIWALIVITFFMAIPLTPLSVGFNALFGSVRSYRFRVAGIRNVTPPSPTCHISWRYLQNHPLPNRLPDRFCDWIFRRGDEQFTPLFYKTLASRIHGDSNRPYARCPEPVEGCSRFTSQINPRHFLRLAPRHLVHAL